MTLEEIDTFCRELPGCAVRYPFDSNPSIRAWCIGRKMFAWTNTDRSPIVIQLKANPDLVPTLISSYTHIQPGYHMNKRHWISVEADTGDQELITGLLEDAHNLVASSLTRTERMRLLSD